MTLIKDDIEEYLNPIKADPSLRPVITVFKLKNTDDSEVYVTITFRRYDPAIHKNMNYAIPEYIFVSKPFKGLDDWAYVNLFIRLRELDILTYKNLISDLYVKDGDVLPSAKIISDYNKKKEVGMSHIFVTDNSSLDPEKGFSMVYRRTKNPFTGNALEDVERVLLDREHIEIRFFGRNVFYFTSGPTFLKEQEARVDTFGTRSNFVDLPGAAEAFMNDPSFIVMSTIIRFTDDQYVLTHFAQSDSPETRRLICFNPNVSKDLLAVLAEDLNEDVAELALNKLTKRHSFV
jgi:hypothetical protein